MAYAFNGTNQKLVVSSSPVSSYPFTLAFAFYKKSTVAKNIVFLSNSNNNSILAGVYFDTSKVRMYIANGAGNSDTPAAGDYTANAWGHVATVFESSTLRTIYRNGGNSAQSTATLTFPAVDQFEIGGATTFYVDADIAEVGLWSAALTAAEVASLASGFTCNQIRPQSLQFYAPLIRDLQDLRGGVSITNNNTATVAVHPRVY